MFPYTVSPVLSGKFQVPIYGDDSRIWESTNSDINSDIFIVRLVVQVVTFNCNVTNYLQTFGVSRDFEFV